MRSTAKLVSTAWLLIALAAPASAIEQIPWQTDLESAKTLAGQQQRLVLVHFYADDCEPCARMERQVFSQPEVSRALAANYVPVKINLSRAPEFKRQFGLTGWPADVILTPEGREVRRTKGFQSANQYIAMTGETAAAFRVTTEPFVERDVETRAARTAMEARAERRGEDGREPIATVQYREPSVYVPPQGPSALPGAAPQDPRRTAAAASPGYGGPAPTFDAPAPGRPYSPADGGAFVPGGDLAGPQRGMSPPQAVQVNPHHAAADRIAHREAPAAEPARSPAPATDSAVGLDGYCPVVLVEHMVWRKGDRQWGAVHRGRTYLFAGPEEQRAFLANPDLYSPALSGYDAVIFAEEGRLVPGTRKYGVFAGTLFLFSDPATRDAFEREPKKYAAIAWEAMEQENGRGHR